MYVEAGLEPAEEGADGEWVGGEKEGAEVCGGEEVS